MARSVPASIIFLFLSGALAGCGNQTATSAVPPAELMPLVSEAMRSQRVAAYVLMNPAIANAQSYVLDDLQVKIRRVEAAVDGATCSAQVRLQGACSILQPEMKPRSTDTTRLSAPPGRTATAGGPHPVRLSFALTRTILFERDGSGHWAVASPALPEIPATPPRPQGKAP